MDAQILVITTYFCFGIFAVFSSVFWVKTYTFHKALKKVDPELHKTIKMKLTGNKPFINFIFNKGFHKLTNEDLLRRCKELYFFGLLGQWGFNLGIVFSVGFFLLHLIATYR